MKTQKGLQHHCPVFHFILATMDLCGRLGGRGEIGPRLTRARGK